MSKSVRPRYLNGAALLEARLEAGLEQQELAEKVGARQWQISGWERGHTGCRLGMLHKLAAALGRNPADLMLPREVETPKAPVPAEAAGEAALWAPPSGTGKR